MEYFMKLKALRGNLKINVNKSFHILFSSRYALCFGFKYKEGFMFKLIVDKAKVQSQSKYQAPIP